MRINFNLQATTAFGGSSPVLPAGVYVVEIVAEREQQLKSGAGSALVFDYQVVDGDRRGVIVRDWLNLGHSSPAARGMAESRLKAIGEAVGVPLFNDTAELFRRPFAVRLSVDKNANGYDRNNVDAYEPAQAAQAFAAPAQVAGATSAQVAATSAPAAGPFWK